MEIKTAYMTFNPCFRAGRVISVKGLMLHSVGCPQPDPWVFYRIWNSQSAKEACVHGFVGQNEAVITLPCLEQSGKAARGWHGGGASNNTHIGIEMCEPACITYKGGANFTCKDPAKARDFVKKATQNAAQLFARLCLFHHLSPYLHILSHAEGAARGIATNHADPEHLWNGLGLAYDMDKFRRDVALCMEQMVDKKDEEIPGFPENEKDQEENRQEERKEEEDIVVRYNKIEDIPDNWDEKKNPRHTIQKLMQAGAICGTGDGRLDLSADMVRLIIMNYRGGCYDKLLAARGMETAL